jgi:hypothetical protein
MYLGSERVVNSILENVLDVILESLYALLIHGCVRY